MQSFKCKAILNKEKVSNTGSDWITSKRCILEVYDNFFKTVAFLRQIFSRHTHQHE